MKQTANGSTVPLICRERRSLAGRGAHVIGAALAFLFIGAAAIPTAYADDRAEARRHFRRGMQYVAEKRYKDAIVELEEANRILPHPSVTFNIAQTYVRAGDLDRAIAAYREYLASDPSDRADVVLLVDKLVKQAAEDRQTKLGREHFERGMDLIGKDQYAEGIRELEAAYAIRPHPAVLFNVARAYADSGNLARAIDKYDEYLATRPSDARQTEAIVAELKTRLAAQQAVASTMESPDPPPSEPPPLAAEPPKENAFRATKRNAGTLVGAAKSDDIYEETVVTASRGAQSPLDAPNSTTVITRQDIRLSGQTRIPELLRRVAGMDVMQITGGDTNVSMRGFNSRFSNKLLVLVNGRSVYNDILGTTFWESFTIDVDQIERIEVVRGPGSALYGADAFAGVVNIITIAPGEGRTGIRVGYGDSQQGYGSAWATGRDGDFAYRASAGYTYYPRWTREVSPSRVDIAESDIMQNTGAQNMRADLRATQRIGKKSELAFGGGYSRNTLDIYGTGPFNDTVLDADTSDITVGFKSENFNIRAYWARLDAYARGNPVYVGHTGYPVNARQNSVDVEGEFVKSFSFPKALRHDFHAGLGYRLKDIEWGYLADDTPREHHVSAFIQDAVAIGKWLRIVGSARADYVPYLEKVVASPRGSIIVKPTERQAVRISGSTAFRTPTYLESYLDLPIQLTLPGAELISASKRPDDPNLALQPEHVTSAEIGYSNQQTDYFEADVTAYYNRVQDLIVLADARPITLSGAAAGLGGLNPETGRYTVAYGGWENQCGVYNVFGGEVGARVYPVEGLDLFANYALNLTTQDRPAGCLVPDDHRTSRHKVNAGVQVRTRMGLSGEVTFHYESAQSWGEQVARLDGIHYEVFELPGYSLVNARLGYRFLKDRAEVSATVFNAFAGVFDDGLQMHPFGNRIGRRFMGFMTYSL